jgi:hypothetical protein
MSFGTNTTTIFVASPSDVSDERSRIEDVVGEINLTLAGASSQRLEIVKWETHSIPGLGADAQDVINRTTPHDFDIFIGLMWQRFGTPTNRAESGTLEEFENAKERHDADPNAVDVMFYFKNKPVPIDELDPEQLAKVQAFKK